MNPGSFDNPRVVSSRQQLREIARSLQRQEKSIGLVPTMGALHEGHLSLVRRSVETCDATLVTIFVNPTQFGPREDLDKYPRAMDEDLAALSELRIDTVFCPATDDVYPPGFSTYVDPPKVAQRWEGKCRPDHFRGVTTVVLKLFQMSAADVAFFGQKDFQQARVIERMVEDLNLPTRIEVCPIVREEDGLAMSSRNRYLDAEQRRRASCIWRALRAARRRVERGERDSESVRRAIERDLRSEGVDRIDYVALVRPDDLEPVTSVESPTVALIAAYVGDTRLIDNHFIA